MTNPKFPGAPEGSYISEEGWLIVGDEAWTEREWTLELSVSARHERNHSRDNPDRRKRMNEYSRRYRARKKAA